MTEKNAKDMFKSLLEWFIITAWISIWSIAGAYTFILIVSQRFGQGIGLLVIFLVVNNMLADMGDVPLAEKLGWAAFIGGVVAVLMIILMIIFSQISVFIATLAIWAYTVPITKLLHKNTATAIQ